VRLSNGRRGLSLELNRRIYLSTLGEILQNWGALAAIILIAAGIYSLIPWAREYFEFTYSLGSLKFDHVEFFCCVIISYLLLLFPYYATIPSGTVTKSVRVWRCLRRMSLHITDKADRVALLATLLKSYYIPLMLVALLFHCTQMAENFSAWQQSGQFFPDGYWFLFRLILVLDVAFFTMGYLIEHPKLNNEIVSVDSTFSGWIVTLLCYPPANELTTGILGNYTTNYPQWHLGSKYAIFSAVAILLLHAAYTSASVFLNLRASNLTFRGVIVKGPYSFIRHPAYSAKIAAWWVGSLPILWMQYSSLGLKAGLLGLFGITGWTAIYVLRAVTEERHLKKVSGEYRQYCENVQYMFIPGLI